MTYVYFPGQNPNSEDAAVLGPRQKWQNAIRRTVVHIVRVSSLTQARESRGSLKTQRTGAETIQKMYDIPPENLQVWNLLGESATARSDRPLFKQLIREVHAGRIGAVSIESDDRGSRNGPDARELFDALADTGGFMIVGGMVLDPKIPHLRLMLEFGAAVAEYQVEFMLQKLMNDRHSNARAGDEFIGQPSGMTLGSPDDEVFVAAMANAGLGDWLEPKRLDLYKTSWPRTDGGIYYPFPYPDREVLDSVELRFEWLYETGGVRGVLDRILTDPRWPHPGQLPSTRSSYYNRSKPHQWNEISKYQNGRASAVALLRAWFRRHSLYGIYHFIATVHRARSDEGKAVKEVISIDHAFRSFRPSDEYPEICRLVAQRGTKGWPGSYTGPRTHLTPEVRCAAIRADGKACGRLLRPAYTEDERVVPYAGTCFDRHDEYAVPVAVVDSVVVAIVQQAYRPALLKRILADARRTDAKAAESIGRMRGRLVGKEQKIQRSIEMGMVASRKEEAEELTRRREKLWDEVTALRRSIEAAERGLALAGTATDADVERLLALASDLSALVESAPGQEGALREVLSAMIGCVRIRPLAKYVSLITVEFPGGGSVSRVALARRIYASQPMRAYAHVHLAAHWGEWVRTGVPDAGRALAVRARKVGSAIEAVSKRQKQYRPWNPERTLSAALAFEFGTEDPLREGEHETAAELSRRIGEPEEEVFATLLLGQLGPARIVGGELAVCASDKELDRRFRGHARRGVARRMGWEVEDTVRAADAARECGMDPLRLLPIMDACDATPQDATLVRWVRRSMTPAGRSMSLGDLAAAADPALAALDPQHWRMLADCDLPGVTARVILARAPKFKPGFGRMGARSWAVWMGPEVLAAIEARRRSRPTQREEGPDASR